MAVLPLPSAEYLRQRVSYDPLTGAIRVNGVRRKVLKPLPKKKGIALFIDGKRYMAHRVIWKMMTGSDPVDGIDHKDHDPYNNRWSNLRAATNAQNRRNSRTSRGLPKGVYEQGGRFRAAITVAGRLTHLGYYDTPEQAHAAYCAAAREADPEFFFPG